MRARLIYWKLEMKRAMRRLPQLFCGAAVLLFLMGTAAFLAGRLLYGDPVSRRIEVGVVLPPDDRLARQAVSMIGSLESVKSLCDFSYVDEEEAGEGLADGSFYAVLLVPEGFIGDIMDGTNTPVQVLLPAGAAVESRIFAQLAQAGADTLAASQAGIYAGDELCTLYGLADSLPQLEADLNRIYLSFSLPRTDYFRSRRVSATGEVDTLTFYGISACTLLLLFGAVPVSSYLERECPALRTGLGRLGVGPASIVFGHLLGFGTLLLCLAIPLAGAAAVLGAVKGGLLLPLALVLVCAAAASFVVLIYTLAGTLMGGVLLLFLLTSVLHFMAGGFLPLVFLPQSLRAVGSFLPPALLMDGLKMAVLGELQAGAVLGLVLMTAVCFLLAALTEEVRR